VPRTPELIQETLCLDYANSVDYSSEDEHPDVLISSDTLGRWGRRLGLLADDAKSASEAELRRARALRAAVYRLFFSISQGQQPTRSDLEALRSNYVEAVEHASLLAGEESYKLDWSAQDPRKIRYAVACDAIALLEDPSRLTRVSLCPGRGCAWLFLNASGRRRWCSMSTCGSRDKMRRLHHRQSQHAR